MDDIDKALANLQRMLDQFHTKRLAEDRAPRPANDDRPPPPDEPA